MKIPFEQIDYTLKKLGYVLVSEFEYRKVIPHGYAAEIFIETFCENLLAGLVLNSPNGPIEFQEPAIYLRDIKSLEDLTLLTKAICGDEVKDTLGVSDSQGSPILH